MAAIDVGEYVYIPRSRLGLDPGDGNALFRTQVKDRKQDGRSIKVDLPGGSVSNWIGTRLAHRNIGVAIVQIEDFDSEAGLTEPLCKSILHFFRVMLTDDPVRFLRIRSRAELVLFWTNNHAAYSHVVVVGHGKEDAVKFAVDGWIGGANLASDFAVPNCSQKVFISLCCKTGRKDFGRPFSESDVCYALIAPFQDVHGAVGSLLTQSYFSHHFLEGMSAKAAYNRIRKRMPGVAKFKYWDNGKSI